MGYSKTTNTQVEIWRLEATGYSNHSWIYYQNGSENLSLYKIRTDGSENQLVQ